MLIRDRDLLLEDGPDHGLLVYAARERQMPVEQTIRRIRQRSFERYGSARWATPREVVVPNIRLVHDSRHVALGERDFRVRCFLLPAMEERRKINPLERNWRSRHGRACTVSGRRRGP